MSIFILKVISGCLTESPNNLSQSMLILISALSFCELMTYATVQVSYQSFAHNACSTSVSSRSDSVDQLLSHSSSSTHVSALQQVCVRVFCRHVWGRSNEHYHARSSFYFLWSCGVYCAPVIGASIKERIIILVPVCP